MNPRLSALFALLAPLAVSARAPEPDPAWRDTPSAQVTVHERIIIRVPRVSHSPVGTRAAAARRAAPVEWEEKKAPRCVAVTTLTGAAIDREGEVDLIVGGMRRLRAKLDAECPTLDFYSGLYLRPTGDGKICARRDVLRSRSGARCAITGFRTLVAKR